MKFLHCLKKNRICRLNIFSLQLIGSLTNISLKKPSLKQNIEKKSKPWITPTLSKSIKLRNRVYKQFYKANDPNKKQKLHECFKNYRSLATIWIRVWKEQYCKSFFQENKKKSMKVWTGIRSILSVTNKSSIQSISLNIDNDEIYMDNDE